jgi:hypothetical protein
MELSEKEVAIDMDYETKIGEDPKMTGHKSFNIILKLIVEIRI